MTKYVSKNLQETKQVARMFLNSIEPGEEAVVAALQGDLGSGKTAFTQAVGEILGIHERMASPTFVIMKVYPIAWQGFKNFIHIDAYRIEHEREILHLGWQELVSEPENLIFVEWPERLADIMPSKAKFAKFKFIDETTREIAF